MNFLLDTSVVSEWIKPRPNPGVVQWLAGADEDRIYMSVVSLGALRYGIERLPFGARRKRLEDWLENDLRDRFESRILAIDEATADAWGRLLVKTEAKGRPMGAIDAFLAATTLAREMSLIT